MKDKYTYLNSLMILCVIIALMGVSITPSLNDELQNKSLTVLFESAHVQHQYIELDANLTYEIIEKINYLHEGK
jgi:hypothetical protein